MIKSFSFLLLSLSFILITPRISSAVEPRITFESNPLSCAELISISDKAIEKRVKHNAERAQAEFEEKLEARFINKAHPDHLARKFREALLRWNMHKNIHQHPWLLMVDGTPQKARMLAKLPFDRPLLEPFKKEVRQIIKRLDEYKFDIKRLQYKTFMLQEKLRIMQSAYAQYKGTTDFFTLRLPEHVSIDATKNDKVTIVYNEETFKNVDRLKTQIDRLIQDAERDKLNQESVDNAEYLEGRHFEQVRLWWRLRSYHQEFIKFSGAYNDVKEKTEGYKERTALWHEIDDAFHNTDNLAIPAYSRKYARSLYIQEVQKLRNKGISYSGDGSSANNKLWANDVFDLNIDGDRNSKIRTFTRNILLSVLPLYMVYDVALPKFDEWVDMTIKEQSTQEEMAFVTGEGDYVRGMNEFMTYHHGSDWSRRLDDPKVNRDFQEFQAFREAYIQKTIELKSELNGPLYGEISKNNDLAQWIMKTSSYSDEEKQISELDKLLQNRSLAEQDAIIRAYNYSKSALNEARFKGANIQTTIDAIYYEVAYVILTERPAFQ